MKNLNFLTNWCSENSVHVKTRLRPGNNQVKTTLRFIALLTLIFTLGVGNAWGTSTNVSFSYTDLIGQGAGSPGAAFDGASKGSITMGGVGNGAASYVQIYQNGTLTFTPLSGATIKSIVLTATNSTYARTWSASPTGVSVSSATITWSGSSTSTVTLTNTFNGQARITAMVVTYDIGTTYDVEWFVGGSSVSHDDAAEPVVTALTGVEDDDLGGTCSSLTFMGWSETNIGSTPTNTRPTDFFGTTIINEDKDYYAVFADCSSESAWEITEIDNINGGTGYGAFDGSHTASGISYTSSDVMEQSSTIQFKAGAGYMYNTTAFSSSITRIVITSNQTDWHVYTSSSEINEQPGSGDISRITMSSGKHTYWVSGTNQTYFFIKGGSALSNSTSIKVYYGAISDYRTECVTCTELGEVDDDEIEFTKTAFTLTVTWGKTEDKYETGYSLQLYDNNGTGVKGSAIGDPVEINGVTDDDRTYTFGAKTPAGSRLTANHQYFIGVTPTYSGAGDYCSTGTEVVGNTTTDPVYTVTYANGGGSGTMTDSNSPYEAGDEVTVLTNTFTKPGYPFAGWSAVDASSNVVDVSSGSFTMPSSNVTITATWGDALVDTFKDKEHGKSDKTKSGANQTTPYCEDVAAGDYCGGKHYKFIGWVLSTSVNDDGTLKNDAVIVPGKQSGWNCTGSTYYAVWAAENENE